MHTASQSQERALRLTTTTTCSWSITNLPTADSCQERPRNRESPSSRSESSADRSTFARSFFFSLGLSGAAKVKAVCSRFSNACGIRFSSFPVAVYHHAHKQSLTVILGHQSLDMHIFSVDARQPDTPFMLLEHQLRPDILGGFMLRHNRNCRDYVLHYAQVEVQPACLQPRPCQHAVVGCRRVLCLTARRRVKPPSAGFPGVPEPARAMAAVIKQVGP